MIAIFVYNLTKVWFRHIWPEIRVPPEEGHDEESRLDIDRWTYLHPQLMTLTELKQVIGNLIKTSELYLQNLLAIRRNRPVAFCSVVCFTLSCTAFIGNRICGSTLIFFITTTLVTAPGIYLYLLPNSAKDYIKHRISSINFLAASTEFQPESSTLSLSSSLLPSPTETTTTLQSTLSDQLRRRIFSICQEKTIQETVCGAKSVEIDSNVAQTNDDCTQLNPNSSEQVDVDQRVDEATSIVENSPPGNTQLSRRNSDDRSSSESASLIGSSEDDQHDGFVML